MNPTRPRLPLYALVLPPLAVLLVLAGLLARESTELSELRTDMERDQAAIARLRDRQSDARHSPATAAPAAPGLMDPARIDWLSVARRWNGAAGPQAGDFSSADGVRLRSQISIWSTGQLTAALDRIEKSDLPESDKSMLAQQLQAALAFRDPAAALARYEASPASFGFMGYNVVAMALGKLARLDPAAACAWLDRQPASAERNPGQPDHRQEYATVLIGGLAASDPAAASQRLAAFPAPLREAMLSAPVDSAAGFAGIARLARESLPEDAVPKALGTASAVVLCSGFDAGSALLDQISASPAERLAVARQMASNPFPNVVHDRDLNENDLHDLQTWMTAQAPDQANELTATAMARSLGFSRRSDDSTVPDLVLDYDPDGSKGLLQPFLKQMDAAGLKANALSLLDRVQDSAKREQLRNSLQ